MYINEAKKDSTFAGDIEISTASILFGCNIRIYYQNDIYYKLLNEFNQIENEVLKEDKDIINLLFINNNHFQLLIKKDYKKNILIQNILKNCNLNELINGANKTMKFETDKISIKNKNNYVKYHRENCENYYNEIYDFIKDNNKYPERILNHTKKKKKIANKKYEYRKMIKKNFRIFNNRLQIKYYNEKTGEHWMNVPYEYEIIPMLSFIHYNNLHLKKEGMCKKIIESGFFWAGYTNTVQSFIENCGKCHSDNHMLKIEKKPKIITSNGPHIRYQGDIWYLPEDLKKGTPYLYILDLIDHFSKWMYSFLLKNKEANLVLAKIKAFISMNGPPKIFHTDNGKEFKNLEVKTYLENNHIIYINSAPYHPQSNGCCEALHKEIKKYLLNDLGNKKDKFDIEISLQNAIEYHNNRVLSSTGYKPVDLRNVTDKDIINDVLKNIIKSMQRKIDKCITCKKNTLLLIAKDIKLKGNSYVLKKTKGKNKFIIPGKLMEYISDDTIKVKISVDLEDNEIFIKNNLVLLNIECCRVIDEFGYSYFMEKNGVFLDIEDKKNLYLMDD